MTTRIQRWGNSLALRLPKAVADKLHLEQGSPVELTVADGKIVVQPRKTPHYRLADLLKKVTKKNIHKEVSDGGLVGRETF